MPRRNRIIIPGEPHHVTQRGSRRQIVFFDHSDRDLYKDLLYAHAHKYHVDIIAYCLMSNHVHHLLVPNDEAGMRWTLQLSHKRYAEYINRRMNWKGHLWQERFYSCPVDSDYFWKAIRYIERNPVAAGIVKQASDYYWSSAAAHCGITTDKLLTTSTRWKEVLEERSNWQDWLSESDDAKCLDYLRSSTSRDLPCGSATYLDDIEKKLGISVRPPQRGRPKKSNCHLSR